MNFTIINVLLKREIFHIRRVSRHHSAQLDFGQRLKIACMAWHACLFLFLFPSYCSFLGTKYIHTLRRHASQCPSSGVTRPVSLVPTLSDPPICTSSFDALLLHRPGSIGFTKRERRSVVPGMYSWLRPTSRRVDEMDARLNRTVSSHSMYL